MMRRCCSEVGASDPDSHFFSLTTIPHLASSKGAELTPPYINIEPAGRILKNLLRNSIHRLS